MKTIERLVSQATDADLLVLPELSNSGYNFTSHQQARQTSEPVPGGTFVDFLLSLSAKHNLYLVAGMNERDGERIYNTAVLVGPRGLVGKYRKLHLFVNEKDWFTPGDIGLPVFDIGCCRVGMLICFDWIFPEAWRVLALRGADLICHPSDLVIPGLAQKAIPVHAVTNRIYVITANRFGTEGDLTFTGLSIIADPKSSVLAQAGPSDEVVTTVDMDIDLARDKNVTPRNHVLFDRRPAEYAALVEDR